VFDSAAAGGVIFTVATKSVSMRWREGPLTGKFRGDPERQEVAVMESFP
jgi:hypothetical protein